MDKEIDFTERYNLRHGDSECGCDNCVHGYVDKYIASAFRCKKADGKIIGCCYMDEKRPGTVCDLFEKKQEV